MKVGISYAVDLGDVPEELQKLVTEVQWDLAEKLIELCDDIEDGRFASAFDNIKNIRHNLQRADTRLEDCASILGGYTVILKNIADKKEEAEEVQLGLGVRNSRPAAVKNNESNDF
jgi:ubiquinone biosynthesis protein UbiJ